MANKKLPIGIQDFPDIITGEYVYVDKTQYYHQLANRGKYYFLSRPRRFGKSLLISTLKAIFEGRRELFEGLWIHDKIAWEPRPVILLDFTQISKISESLNEGIAIELTRIATSYGLVLNATTNAGRLQAIIRELGKERRVAILVDEYDKPLIDFIDQPERLKANQQVMKDMYSVLKGNDQYIDFLILTGVTKFSQVSIFSDLNNLEDITLHPEYAQMLGYTQEEIQQYFAAHLALIAPKFEKAGRDLLAEMKEWYNGYSWDGETFVYNPFSVLNFLSKQRFQDFWFATGTPTFLMKLIRQESYSILEMENLRRSFDVFGTFDLTRIEISSMLFQTGYLTIKRLDDFEQVVTLGFPNREVANAFSIQLLAEFAEKRRDDIDSMILKMNDDLSSGAVGSFLDSMKALFAGIAYPIQPAERFGIDNMERYYHSMFFLLLKLLGFKIQAEVLTSNGRIDAVISTERNVYVVEFKLGDAATAMAQIKERGYHQQYLSAGKTVMLLGIGFDVKTRNVGDFVVEVVETA